jgi:hypothetical protein
MAYMVKIAYFYNNLHKVELVKFSNPTAFARVLQYFTNSIETPK